MFWIETAVTLVAAIVLVMLVMLVKRPAEDLGSVSDHWVAEHRAER
jgi:hypothetical protein